jgi:archaemetzincin
MRGCTLLALLLLASPAWAIFHRPSENDRAIALGNLFEEKPVARALLTPHDDWLPILSPAPGDWLAVHTETGQPFDAYRDQSANRPDVVRRIIYLQPIAAFPSAQVPALEVIRTYAAAYYQMEVSLLPVYDPTAEEFSPRQHRRTGQRQILTRDVLAFLRTRLPADAFCLLAITLDDLYPSPSWNYVFGEASLSERVGVYSLARYDAAFWKEARPKNHDELMLQRSAKVLVHETGHMFGLLHCIYYQCVLNGSNSLVETDAGPQHLCPVCLRKLAWNTGLDLKKRYEELAAFYRRQGWQEDHDWVARQLRRIEPPAP